VDRPHRFVDDFGAPRYSGGYHRHEGIDIFARASTPVRAPFDGRAEVSTNWAGGLTVTVHGSAGFVYNAHLSSRGLVGRVRAGDLVGRVGSSGNAAGGSPHDHFEWHPHGGGAANPYPLLTHACRERPTNASPGRAFARIL
jgi:peptidoglycan LD-endopeptidase LytH